MENKTQKEYLCAVKEELGVTWDELAVLAGIEPRALKTYRMPETSTNYRGMSLFVRQAIENVLANFRAAHS